MNSTLLRAIKYAFFRQLAVLGAMLLAICIISTPARASVLYAQYLDSHLVGSIIKFTPDGVGSVFASIPTANYANDIASDSAGNLYVGTRMSTIEKITPNGVVSDFATPTVWANGVGDSAIAFDNTNNLYLQQCRWIEKFSPTGTSLGMFATTQDLFPGGALSFDRAGNLYTKGIEVDHTNNTLTYTILKYTPDGVGSVFARSAYDAYPLALTFDRAGNLYMAETTNTGGTKIEKFSSSGTDLGVFANSVNNSSPVDIAFDSEGNLYMANQSGSIEKFSPSGIDLGVFGATNVDEDTGWSQYGSLWGITLVDDNSQSSQGLALAPEPSSTWALLALCVPVVFGMFRQRLRAA